MSRAWKSLPTHLPGWNSYAPPDTNPPKRNKANQFRKRWRHTARTKSLVKRTKPIDAASPTTLKLLRVEADYFVAGAIFQRKHGKWHCIKAAPIISWMTRVSHPEVILNWLKSKHFSYQWLNATNACAANLVNQAEDVPAEAQTPQVASVSQENNTNTSLNNETQPSPRDGQSAYKAALEQNGLTMPRCLIAPECSGENSDRSVAVTVRQ